MKFYGDDTHLQFTLAGVDYDFVYEPGRDVGPVCTGRWRDGHSVTREPPTNYRAWEIARREFGLPKVPSPKI